MQTKREERGDERRTPHRLALLLRFQDRWRSTNSQSLGSRLGTCTYTLLYIECTPAGNRRKSDLEQITDKNQQTQRKESRQDTRFHSKLSRRIRRIYQGTKRKTNKELRPYVYAMYALFSRRFHLPTSQTLAPQVLCSSISCRTHRVGKRRGCASKSPSCRPRRRQRRRSHRSSRRSRWS